MGLFESVHLYRVINILDTSPPLPSRDIKFLWKTRQRIFKYNLFKNHLEIFVNFWWVKAKFFHTSLNWSKTIIMSKYKFCIIKILIDGLTMETQKKSIQLLSLTQFRGKGITFSAKIQNISSNESLNIMGLRHKLMT